jgi:hypothetical protein
MHFFHGCPVAATVAHPSSLSHDFSKSPVLVPMKVTLRNRMLESPVEFQISLQPTANFELIGAKMHKFKLDASEEVTIPYQALVTKSGTYDLQALRLTIMEETEITYELSQQWLVSLKDTASHA